MHSLSILITVSTEFFFVSPLLMHAHYSCLNSAMLGRYILRDASRQIHLWDCSNIFSTTLQTSYKRSTKHCHQQDANSKHHDQCSCNLVYTCGATPSTSPNQVPPYKIASATGFYSSYCSVLLFLCFMIK